MEIALEKARAHSLGAVTIYNQSHNGARSYYVRMAADQNMVALMFGNSTPRVAPYGGRAGLHGTNPVACGIPGGPHAPMVCDFATAASGAAIRQAVEDQVPSIPENLALEFTESAAERHVKALEDDFAEGVRVRPYRHLHCRLGGAEP